MTAPMPTRAARPTRTPRATRRRRRAAAAARAAAATTTRSSTRRRRTRGCAASATRRPTPACMSASSGGGSGSASWRRASRRTGALSPSGCAASGAARASEVGTRLGRLSIAAHSRPDRPPVFAQTAPSSNINTGARPPAPLSPPAAAADLEKVAPQPRAGLHRVRDRRRRGRRYCGNGRRRRAGARQAARLRRPRRAVRRPQEGRGRGLAARASAPARRAARHESRGPFWA
ncbi:MAG: hypothetical protein J3K34DRAFT_413764 [Monoraphidium minutum]|nr:MAG: hypothetical protein J3K34DRAFT_413764 [Monoraphidium minutum]